MGPLWPCSPLNYENSLAFGQNATLEKLPQWKITEIVATRCQILRLKCTKFDFDWGPAGGAIYSAPPDLLDGFNESYF